MEKRLAIVGAGISGLLACKYAVAKGLIPVVFEAEEGVGGVWNCTVESTKLQNPRPTYEFSDFPWPSSVEEMFPNHSQVLEYLQSYAKHFGLFPYIKFNSKVISLDYVGESNEELEAFHLWGGTGKPFQSKGKWHLVVQDTKGGSTQVYQLEFVILCIGKFSGVPNIPDFPIDKGPEVFNGKVIHSMDYSALDNDKAAELIQRKRVIIIGSQKSAIDIASECANANGSEYPCYVIQRTAHWQLPSPYLWGVNYGLLYSTRFSELFLHKPGETFLQAKLATLLSPLRWVVTKFAESYLKWKLPLKKYGVVPKMSFLQDISSGRIAILPENFYEKVEQGSIILKKLSQSFSFCKEGIVIDDGATDHPIEADLVILATGYRGDIKLQNMFKSPFFKSSIAGSPGSKAPFYRQVIHPRIPQLAVIGYADSLSNLFSSEMRCQWLAQFLSGGFELPSISDMEKDVKIWENSLKLYSGKDIGGSCLNVFYNDQLCKDMGCNPKRKEGVLAEWFIPHMPSDYAGLTNN